MAMAALQKELGVPTDTTFCDIAMEVALTTADPSLIRKALLLDAEPNSQLEHALLDYGQASDELAQAVLQALNA